MRNLSYLAVLFLALLAGCQKKEVKPLSRCIYDQPVFAEVARKAVADPEQFKRFKSDPYFTLLWENRSFQEGVDWFQKIQANYPPVVGVFTQVFLIDQIGSPRAYSFYGPYQFSPSTLRVAAIAGDIQCRMGSFEKMRIVQIGAGCGTLCTLLLALCPCASYTIIDLPEQLALAKKCLECLGVHNIEFLTPEELSKNGEYDLVVSDLGFSEFNRSYQQLFFDRVLSRSRNGYILGHMFPKHYGVVAMNMDDLHKQMEKRKFAELEVQDPALDEQNILFYGSRD